MSFKATGEERELKVGPRVLTARSQGKGEEPQESLRVSSWRVRQTKASQTPRSQERKWSKEWSSRARWPIQSDHQRLLKAVVAGKFTWSPEMSFHRLPINYKGKSTFTLQRSGSHHLPQEFKAGIQWWDNQTIQTLMRYRGNHYIHAVLAKI